MPEKPENTVFPSYPHWRVQIEVIIRPGECFSVNTEGTGYDTLNRSVTSFLTRASSSFLTEDEG